MRPRNLTATTANKKKHKTFGKVNQNTPAKPFVYACKEHIKIAGAQTQLTAMDKAPRHVETERSATKNPSLVTSALNLVRTDNNMTAAKTPINEYISKDDKPKPPIIEA
jgi:hypothetical protein